MANTSGEWVGDWKIILDTGETLLKVVGFPGGESMWVRVISGSDYSGIGYIENEPFCSTLQRGHKVRYGGGTKERKPEFKGGVPRGASRFEMK
jgi:hypothetical protein